MFDLSPRGHRPRQTAQPRVLLSTICVDASTKRTLASWGTALNLKPGRLMDALVSFAGDRGFLAHAKEQAKKEAARLSTGHAAPPNPGNPGNEAQRVSRASRVKAKAV